MITLVFNEITMHVARDDRKRQIRETVVSASTIGNWNASRYIRSRSKSKDMYKNEVAEKTSERSVSRVSNVLPWLGLRNWRLPIRVTIVTITRDPESRTGSLLSPFRAASLGIHRIPTKCLLI